jgi:hypothetical protein
MSNPAMIFRVGYQPLIQAMNRQVFSGERSPSVVVVGVDMTVGP